MRHLTLFEAFSSEPLRCTITFSGCTPDCMGNPGNWTTYNYYLHIPIDDVRRSVDDLFGLDLSPFALEALKQGKFKLDRGEARDYSDLDLDLEDEVTVMAGYSGSLDEFAEYFQREIYNQTLSWHKDDCVGYADEEDDDEDDYGRGEVNDEALYEIIMTQGGYSIEYF